MCQTASAILCVQNNNLIKMSSSCEEETPLLTSQVSECDIDTESGYDTHIDSETDNDNKKQKIEENNIN